MPETKFQQLSEQERNLLISKLISACLYNDDFYELIHRLVKLAEDTGMVKAKFHKKNESGIEE